jgi:signal transduction histidine kinase
MLKRFFQTPALMRAWEFWTTNRADPVKQTARIRFMERGVVLPVKAALLLVLFYLLFFSNWFQNLTSTWHNAFEIIKVVFLCYAVLSIAVGSVVYGLGQLPFTLVQNAVSIMAVVDGLFLTAMTTITGGFNSLLYWVFHGLIIRNAIIIPGALFQIVTNLLLCVLYVIAGMLDTNLADAEFNLIRSISSGYSDPSMEIDPKEPILLRLLELLLMTVCCYGVQVLFDKQAHAEEEAREFALRQQQLQATGRLAAEIAHQIKNPLAIINNAAFSLQQMAKDGKPASQQQIDIIREEVQRSDRIITELMGYAQLVEGQVEKVHVPDELDLALQQALPAAANFRIEIKRDYASVIPPLLVQRGHLSEVFVNILQNAREAMNGVGQISVTAKPGDDYSVRVVIADNGPGIPPEAVHKIFEPYFTTKEKGSGLGLAIVKHNVEIYGGTISVESELGKGTRFILNFPARTMMKIRK